METHDELQSNHSPAKWVGALLLGVVALGGGFGIARLSQQKAQIRDLATTNQNLSASVAELRSQLRTMTTRLDEQAAAARAEAQTRIAATAVNRPRASSSTPARSAGNRQTVDPRLTQIQSRLEQQQKEISSNRDDLNRTRDDLQGKLDSTRDELSGSISGTRDELSASIARTHEDVVALQKRGDRNYFEFTLTKYKEFRRVGPLSVSVRKVNTKRKSYDLAMFVDDNQLQKKSVNLFEPVWINLQDLPSPVELVVNQISKDQIQGYIAAPKYKRSELGETASSSARSPALPALKEQ